MRHLTLILILFFCSGCATINTTGLIDASQSDSLQNAVIHGVRLAHPELTEAEARQAARKWWSDNKQSVVTRYNRLIESEEFTQAQSALFIALYVRSLMYNQGGDPLD